MIFPKKNKFTYNVDSVKEALYSGSDSYIVFTESELTKVKDLLKPQIEDIALLYKELNRSAINLMKVHAPKNIGNLIEKIVSQTTFFRTVGLIGKCAVLSGEVVDPYYDKPIAVFVYRTTEHDKVSVNVGVQV